MMKNQIDRRKHARVSATYNAKVLFGNGSTDVEIANMSLGGVLFHSKKQFGLGEMVTIMVTGVYRGVDFQESVPGKIVAIYRREDQHAYGFQFATALQAEQTPSLAAFSAREGEMSFLRDPRYKKAARKG